MRVTEIMLRSRGRMRALDQLVDVAGLVSHSQLIEGDLPTTHSQQPFDIATWALSMNENKDFRLSIRYVHNAISVFVHLINLRPVLP